MSELRDLYQDVILDHSKRPRNFGTLPAAQSARGHNPLCGDELTVYVVVKDDAIDDVRFEGTGCAISTAAASMMTQALKGMSVADAEALFARYHEMVTGRDDVADHAESLGKLAAFEGVSEFPVRVKCATLSWHTLMAALENRAEPVTTE